jgi:hypothetical protein
VVIDGCGQGKGSLDLYWQVGIIECSCDCTEVIGENLYISHQSIGISTFNFKQFTSSLLHSISPFSIVPTTSHAWKKVIIIHIHDTVCLPTIGLVRSTYHCTQVTLRSLEGRQDMLKKECLHLSLDRRVTHDEWPKRSRHVQGTELLWASGVAACVHLIVSHHNTGRR